MISAEHGQRDPLRLQLLVPRTELAVVRRGLPRAQLGGRRRPSQPLRVGRTPITTAGPAPPSAASADRAGDRRRRQRDGLDLQRVQRDEQSRRGAHAAIRLPGRVARDRPGHDDRRARRLHLQRPCDGRREQSGERRRRLPARLLLDLHGHLRRRALDLQVTDLRAVHRRRLAGQRRADAAARHPLGVSRAVARSERHRRIVRSGDGQDRVPQGPGRSPGVAAAARHRARTITFLPASSRRT